MNYVFVNEFLYVRPRKFAKKRHRPSPEQTVENQNRVQNTDFRKVPEWFEMRNPFTLRRIINVDGDIADLSSFPCRKDQDFQFELISAGK